MAKRAASRAVGAAFAFALIVVSCTGRGPPSGPNVTGPEEPWRGGTLRMVGYLWPVEMIDPRYYGYSGLHWELYRCCLLRTLFSYEAVPAADGGTIARADLASGEPQVSDDGLTWTIRLRKGLRYGPPFEDTEIVAADFVRALERLGDPELPPSGYPPYFEVIEGFGEFQAGTTDRISGIETPDSYTLVIHLTEPSGDLPYRFTLPPTSPIPEGAPDGHDDDYIRFLVSTGPYMIDGSQDLEFSPPPREQTPAAGFVPDEHMTLVRNPSWMEARDPLRPAYVDRIEIELITRDELFSPRANREVVRRIDEGSIDLSNASPTQEQIDRYVADPLHQDQVVDVPQNSITYIPINLALPPMDDPHVRRAAVLAIDRARIARRFTQLSAGDRTFRPVSHLLSASVEGALLPDAWRPMWASGVPDSGDVDAARAEMALSRYDHDGDGTCDDAACRGIHTLVETEAFGESDYSWWWTQVRDDLAAIGLELEPRILPCWVEGRVDIFDLLDQPDTQYGIALSYCAGWIPDFPDGSTFIPLLAAGRNYSLLGATSEQLRSWGYEVTEVPSVDDRIDACMVLTGSEHTRCWARLDQYLSQEIVPWVPMFTDSRRFVFGERIDHLSVDVQNGRPALDQISLVPGSE